MLLRQTCHCTAGWSDTHQYVSATLAPLIRGGETQKGVGVMVRRKSKEESERREQPGRGSASAHWFTGQFDFMIHVRLTWIMAAWWGAATWQRDCPPCTRVCVCWEEGQSERGAAVLKMMGTQEATMGLSTDSLHLSERCVLPPDWAPVRFLKVLSALTPDWMWHTVSFHQLGRDQKTKMFWMYWLRIQKHLI